MLVTDNAPLADYQKNTNIKNQKNLLKKLELGFNDFKKIKKYCDIKKIQFLCTPFDIESLDFLVKELKLKTVKVSSGDITNYQLLYQIGKYKKNIILSTGNSNLKEIDLAIKFYILGYEKKNTKQLKLLNNKNTFNKYKKKINIMHCISSYPTKINHLNLDSINYLKFKYPQFSIGLSDHSREIHTPLVAMGIGIDTLEKHFTINKLMNGPDHKASLNPNELKNMIKLIRSYEKSFGQFDKKPQVNEKNNLNIVRRSIYANKDIKKGEKFNFNNITLKRPYNRKSNPLKFWKLISSKAKKDYKKSEII
jgi:N-acetylneuraminate synthase